jgi:hypothetical protein
VRSAGVRTQRALEVVDARTAGQPVASEDGDNRGDVIGLDELPAVRDHRAQFGGISADLSG